MKEVYEGEKGSILWQSSTKAVREETEVKGEEETESLIWTYAYFELAERGYVDENGSKKLFSGFIGEQASHLFEMTRTREN